MRITNPEMLKRFFEGLWRKRSVTKELVFTLEVVKSRIGISENQISNVVDEGKINTERKNKVGSGAIKSWVWL